MEAGPNRAAAIIFLRGSGVRTTVTAKPREDLAGSSAASVLTASWPGRTSGNGELLSRKLRWFGC
jgi:hypothetical protein